MNKRLKRMTISIGDNPVYFRADSPDLDVINDTLVCAEYDCVSKDVRDAKFIVDCGAYAGYSSLYFLNKYENAHVAAIEADPDNFAVLRRNLAPYGGRVTAKRAAVWSKQTGLVLRKGQLADGREWATMVTPPVGGETSDVTGIDLGTVLRESGFAKIDLLKVNIECAETAVFSENFESWLPHVKNIVIQLHDQRAEDAFFSALSEYGFYLARPPTLVTCTSITKSKNKPRATGALSDGKNVLENGDFENLRVAPAQVVPGGWIAGSTEIAKGWQVVACDQVFHVSLAVRTGAQRSGENALCIRMNPNHPVLCESAPYAAIENTCRLGVREGQGWHVRAFTKTSGVDTPAPGISRGAYAFLRVRYTDGSYADAGINPLTHVTGEYRELDGVVRIPPAPPGSDIEHATLWLYAWVSNSGTSDVPATSATWEVVFDDVACAAI